MFYKKLDKFWEKQQVTYILANTLLVDDSGYKCLWNPAGTFLIVKKLEQQSKAEIKTYLTKSLRKWLEKWLVVKDCMAYTVEN